MFKYFFFLLICFSIFGCKQNNTPAAPAEKVYPEPKRQAPATITYLIADAKAWLLSHQADSNHLSIVLAANRTDSLNFSKMDSVIVPTDLTGDIAFYLPFPLKVPYLRDVQKIVFFSYPTQTFATYEHGHLIYTGATNMGRQKDTTPTGLFFTNWKAEETISTFNDEWELRWNFNISNLEGIGWHQYSLPGYPASHSCLRLQEKDAKYLFDWADQWELNDQDSILVKGTPVIVYGKYDFDSTKAWLQLVADPKALDISEAEIEKETSLYLTEILNEQKKREAFQIEKKQ